MFGFGKKKSKNNDSIGNIPPPPPPENSRNPVASLPPAASRQKMLNAAGPTNPVEANTVPNQQSAAPQKKAVANSIVNGSIAGGKTTLLNVPSLKATPPTERPAMFQNHLILTQQVFNFNDPTANVEEKEAKRALLLGLVEHINSSKDVFTDNVFPDVIAMLSANLFRDLPSRGDGDGEGEDDEPVLEPAWPHLQIVYEFLLRFVVSADVDAKVAKKHISQPFISQLLELFNSEDPREREYLKTILHRIYGKYMGLRAFIRRAINYVFFRVMYESERHNGIGELLEILGSIINGFALPLKAEHKRFLVRALIPLHKVKSVATFHNQLAYCVTQFVEKDPKMIEPIVLGILRFWPNSSSPKQVLFLNELEDLLELTQPSEFAKIAGPLFERINLCVDSPHFQVAERALFLWNNEYIVSLIAQNRHLVLPLVISSLSKNAAEHWNATVTSLTGNVLKLFVEMDKNYFKECREATQIKEKEHEDVKQKRLKQWELVEKEAKANQVI
jgi:serine/threonine-protein phosphatase 2A regulatory subunit B'